MNDRMGLLVGQERGLGGSRDETTGREGRMLDLIIRGGRVLDGTGGPWLRADVGVAEGQIAAMGRLDRLNAREVLDATGMMVCPGFVDVHSHSDLALFADPSARPKIAQGITTEVVGNCGWGPAPLPPVGAAAWRQTAAGVLGDPAVRWTWRTFGDYLEALRAQRPGLNVAALLPHGAVRNTVMGMADRPPSAEELAQMEGVVTESMDAGAVGLSAGLVYAPGGFAQAPELAALARVAGRYGGILTVHLRSYGGRLVEAIEEAVTIAQRADIPLQISHLSIVGSRHAGVLDAALERIERARERGLDLTFDQQPYEAASSTLSLLFPPWALAGGLEATLERLRDPVVRTRLARAWSGEAPEAPEWENYVGHCGWDRVLMVGSARGMSSGIIGMSLAALARREGRDPAEATIDLWVEERGAATIVLLDLFPTATIERIVQHPLQMVATDAVLCEGLPHPRLYGAYPRVLGLFARDRGLLSLGEAVRKMSSLPAQRFSFGNRGVLRPGMAADLVVFDPEHIRDMATYTAPQQPPEGIRRVLVNGRPAGERGAGQVLRG